MPTWAELQEYAREKYELAEDEPERFRLVFEYETGRRQAILVTRFEAMGRAWIDFASACCRRDQMDPLDALRRNFEMALGAICLSGDIYLVRHSALLETMDLAEFELPLHVIARTADELERELARSDVF
ncbi:MAG: hypothetical protein OEY14_10905 [Myxococcales bacterium]|nr:hypothetical protein [Myxococcales bacterium]